MSRKHFSDIYKIIHEDIEMWKYNKHWISGVKSAYTSMLVHFTQYANNNGKKIQYLAYFFVLNLTLTVFKDLRHHLFSLRHARLHVLLGTTDASLSWITDISADKQTIWVWQTICAIGLSELYGVNISVLVEMPRQMLSK